MEALSSNLNLKHWLLGLRDLFVVAARKVFSYSHLIPLVFKLEIARVKVENHIRNDILPLVTPICDNAVIDKFSSTFITPFIITAGIPSQRLHPLQAAHCALKLKNRIND